MQLTRQTALLPLARVFALVALLCTGALQVQEASHGHWHDLDDSYSQCLLCQSSGAVALPQALPRAILPQVRSAGSASRVTTILAGASAPFQPRGPPLYT